MKQMPDMAYKYHIHNNYSKVDECTHTCLLQHPSQPWRSAIRTYPSPHNYDTGSGSDSAPLLPAGLIGSLQSRSLTESDYELLLQLDRPRNTSQTAGGVPERILNSFHVEPIDSDSPLLLSRAHCQVCMNSYRRGEWIRKLPCKHQVCFN